MGSGISETESQQPAFEGEKTNANGNGSRQNGGQRKVNGNAPIVNYAKESVAPVFEEVDLNSCGSSNEDSIAISDDQNTNPDENLNPTNTDVIVQQDHLHPLATRNTKDTFDRSVSHASSNSGKSTPKQKISWGQVDDIPVPDPIPNEREENHISRNEYSLSSAKSIPNKVSQHEACFSQSSYF